MNAPMARVPDLLKMTWNIFEPGPWWYMAKCSTCGAWATEPCRDRRKKLRHGMTGKELYKKHPCKYRRKR